MRQLAPYVIWLGHAGDARDLRGLSAAEIVAVVDLAANEPVAIPSRELSYCRFPLVDGPDNPPWLLRAAIETTAAFIRNCVPTLVCCGAGMSRSPAIVAAAIALAEHRPAEDCLAFVTRVGACDVSPALWRDVTRALSAASV